MSSNLPLNLNRFDPNRVNLHQIRRYLSQIIKINDWADSHDLEWI
jgi:hypothetical protein